MKITCLLVLVLVGLAPMPAFSQSNRPPVRIAIAGLEHDHAMGFIPRFAGRTDVELAGIVETNRDLIQRYSQRFNLDPGLFYPSLAALFAKTNVDAVATFTSTFAHQRVVEACAAQGVDVMMEKPLATTMKQARAIEAAVKKSGIELVVNYETTWYPATQAAYKVVDEDGQIGPVRKMVFHDGHRGPKEIGCSTNFLAWLTDPVLNGGGAVNDFGCYGADLATWFMGGQRPVSVFCAAQHLKPQIYPKVEDDATIIVNYTGAQVILQPSWNWAFDRKDMEIYGQTGTVFVPKPTVMRVRTGSMVAETETTLPSLKGADGDPLSYLAAVARNQLKPSGLSSLEVNVIVVEILEAAHKSAETGREVKF
jgi:predicted dehydrogenase